MGVPYSSYWDYTRDEHPNQAFDEDVEDGGADDDHYSEGDGNGDANDQGSEDY
jgi:hypothetical protein